MKTVIYFLFLLIALSGCQSGTKEISEPKDSSVRTTSSIDSILMKLAQTPDSLRTSEQKETIKKIQKMIARYVELKDGKFSFTLPKKNLKLKLDLELNIMTLL